MNRRVRWLVVWVMGVLLLGGCKSPERAAREAREQGSPFENTRMVARPADAVQQAAVSEPAPRGEPHVIDDAGAGPMGEQTPTPPSTTADAPGAAAAGTSGPESGLQPAAPINVRDLLQLRAREEPMAITQGKLEGERTVLQVIPAGKDGWTLRDPKGTTTHVYLNADGDVLATSEEDVEENVIVEYEPALRLLPATLVQGQPVTDSSHMFVYNRKTKKLRDQGTIDVEIELMGRQHMQTPAGEMAVNVVRTTRRIRLNLAEATVTTYAAYAPGRGLVAERVEQNTKAIGIFSGTKTSEIRLSK